MVVILLFCILLLIVFIYILKPKRKEKTKDTNTSTSREINELRSEISNLQSEISKTLLNSPVNEAVKIIEDGYNVFVKSFVIYKQSDPVSSASYGMSLEQAYRDDKMVRFAIHMFCYYPQILMVLNEGGVPEAANWGKTYLSNGEVNWGQVKRSGSYSVPADLWKQFNVEVYNVIKKKYPSWDAQLRMGNSFDISLNI